jgi:hypothetical protein
MKPPQGHPFGIPLSQPYQIINKIKPHFEAPACGRQAKSEKLRDCGFRDWRIKFPNSSIPKSKRFFACCRISDLHLSI